MLKKKIALTLAAAMMTLSASSAFAAFADLELIRVYYDRGGAEIATDLGKVTDLTAAGAVNKINGSFGSLVANANTFAVYFAIDRTNNDIWASGSTTIPSVINGGSLGMTSLKNGVASMFSTYGTGTSYTGLASATNSFKNKLSAAQGTLASAINNATRLNTEASLTTLLSTGQGSVTQSLYYWGNGLTTVAADKIGQLQATIVTNADGSTVVTSSTPAVATPIPAAFYLMGSGLMGLVGMRRRKNA